MLAVDDVGEGSPALVLLPGWGADRRLFERLVAVLGGGYRTVSVDLRGFGGSAAPEGGYRVEDHASDVSYAIETLGLDRPVIVGHSLGGMVALELARRATHCRAVILLETPVVTAPDFFRGVRRVLAGLRTDEYRAVATRFVEILAGPGLDPAAREQLVRAATTPSQDVLVAAMEALLAYDSDTAARQVTCPLLYVGTATPYADLERFRSLCPQLETAELADCGHYFPLEAPSRLADPLIRFLRMHSRSGS